MGLLKALGLPEPKHALARTAGKAPAPAATARHGANGTPAGPVVNADNLASLSAGPVVDKRNLPAASLPTGEEVGWGDFSLGMKKSADGTTLSVKYERKQNVGRQNFKVWVIPCYVKADIKFGVEGTLTIGKKGSEAVNASSAGSLELGVGGTSEIVTAGPYGAAELSASTRVPTSLSEALEIAIKPFAIDIYGTGKVGIKFEIEKAATYNAEAILAHWHLFVLHVGTYANGGFASFRVEPGKDMQRLIATMEQVGPTLADAVETYAPEAVKKLAEDGAHWAAEDRKSKQIADATHKVLEELKRATGVDVGGGIEKSVQFLVDPGGETSSAATERVRQEMVAFNASYGDYKAVMAASGLDTELVPPYRTSEEYNAIVDAWARDAELVAKGGTGSGTWRPMVAALVVKARTAKAAVEAATAQAHARNRDAAQSAAAMDLAQRVKQSEARMNAMLQEANRVGIPLKKDAEASANKRAFAYWQTGMLNYWQKGQTAMSDAKNLQGDARIARAEDAAALFGKARTVFQEGRRLL